MARASGEPDLPGTGSQHERALTGSFANDLVDKLVKRSDRQYQLTEKGRWQLPASIPDVGMACQVRR